VRRRKTAPAETATTANDRRRNDLRGGETVPNASPDILSMQAVYDGQRCLGHLLLRGKQGIEAFDADDHSLGIYQTQRAAADAVSLAARGTAP